MEIEKMFSTIEEIKAEIEKEGFTFRYSFDEDEEEENLPFETQKQTISSDRMTFAVDSDPAEIEKWEAALPDIDDEEEPEEINGSENVPGEIKEQQKQQIQTEKTPKNAAVLYFDLFKKRTYIKTLIFQKDETETKETIYCLVGFCEAPMS